MPDSSRDLRGGVDRLAVRSMLPFKERKLSGKRLKTHKFGADKAHFSRAFYKRLVATIDDAISNSQSLRVEGPAEKTLKSSDKKYPGLP